MTTVNMLDAKTRLSQLVEALPPHHSDPFDRLLIAQARTEPMRLLSHDVALAAYGELVVAV